MKCTNCGSDTYITVEDTRQHINYYPGIQLRKAGSHLLIFTEYCKNQDCQMWHTTNVYQPVDDKGKDLKYENNV